MSPQSELGPLDVVFDHNNTSGRRMMACDMLNSVQYICDLSEQLVIKNCAGQFRYKDWNIGSNMSNKANENWCYLWC